MGSLVTAKYSLQPVTDAPHLHEVDPWPIPIQLNGNLELNGHRLKVCDEDGEYIEQIVNAFLEREIEGKKEIATYYDWKSEDNTYEFYVTYCPIESNTKSSYRRLEVNGNATVVYPPEIKASLRNATIEFTCVETIDLGPSRKVIRPYLHLTSVQVLHIEDCVGLKEYF